MTDAATRSGSRKRQKLSDADSGPLRRASLVELAYERVQQRIVSGQLDEGARLVIDELAREFGISPIPVREALVRLKVERMVVFEANKGYRVAPKPDPVELEHLYQGRLILEIGAVTEGFDAVNEQTLETLSELNRELSAISVDDSAEANKAFILKNEAFHLELVGLSRNPFIIDAYNRLGYHQRMLQTLYYQGDPDSGRVVGEHEEIIQCLRSGNPGAVADALRRHIVGGQWRLKAINAGKAGGT